MEDSGIASQLVLETPNPSDLTLDELRELQQLLTATLNRQGPTDIVVSIAGTDQYGSGTAFWDVIRVWLPNTEFLKESGFTTTIGVVAWFLKRRFERPHEEKRIRSIEIYGPDGRQLKKIIIERADSEPAINEPDENEGWSQGHRLRRPTDRP